MTTLLLVRHGETAWNREGRWQGQLDTHLNDVGREQAARLAAELEGVDVVYSSDLARARETADILAARLELPVLVDHRLRERSFGAWEGKTGPEIETDFAAEHARWLAGEAPGAEDSEPPADFAARVRAVIEDILERHPGETVLVVSHGGSIRVVQALAKGIDYFRDRRSIPGVPNCAVVRYRARNGRLQPID